MSKFLPLSVSLAFVLAFSGAAQESGALDPPPTAEDPIWSDDDFGGGDFGGSEVTPPPPPTEIPDDPFADPFSETADTPPANDPFADTSPSGESPADDPFADPPATPSPVPDAAASASSPEEDPFADPFANPPATPAASDDPFADPFANPPATPAASDDPFADPFADPPATPAASDDPFADPFADPPATPAASDDPFADPPPTPAPSDDPFADPPPTPAPSDDPFADPPATPAASDDPFADPPPTPAPSDDPFADPPTTPAASDDPFANLPPAPPPGTDPFADAAPSPPASSPATTAAPAPAPAPSLRVLPTTGTNVAGQINRATGLIRPGDLPGQRFPVPPIRSAPDPALADAARGVDRRPRYGSSSLPDSPIPQALPTIPEGIVDIPQDLATHAAVHRAIDLGLMETHYGRFYPDKLFTRYRFAVICAKILDRMRWSQKGVKPPVIPDLGDGDGHWATMAVEPAVVSKLMLPFKDCTFKGNGLVDRYNLAVFFAGMMRLIDPEVKLKKAKNVPWDMTWKHPWVTQVREAVGERALLLSNHKLYGNTPVSRLELALFLDRVLPLVLPAEDLSLEDEAENYARAVNDEASLAAGTRDEIAATEQAAILRRRFSEVEELKNRLVHMESRVEELEREPPEDWRWMERATDQGYGLDYGHTETPEWAQDVDW